MKNGLKTMKIELRKLAFLCLVGLFVIVSACKNKDPSILKVFVRTANSELVANAKVIVIADVSSNPPTPAYVDTVPTNSSGFAEIDLEEFFASLDKDVTTGYFDIIAKKDGKQGEGYVQCRAHITSVQTVNFEP